MYEYSHGGNAAFELGKENIIDLSANINPLGMPEGVEDAIISGISRCTRYPDNFSRGLTEKIAGYENVDAGRIFCAGGASDVIFRLPKAVNARKVMITAPSFADYERSARAAEAEVIRHALSSAGDFDLGTDFVEDVSRLEPDMVFVCNPNNPTGRLVEPGLIEDLLECCRRTCAHVVVDECFLDFTTQAKEYTSKRFLENYKNIVILKAFTKVFALPGIRLGYAMCGDMELTQKLYGFGADWPVSNLAQSAGVAAIENAESFISETVRFVSAERLMLEEELNDLGYTVITAAANYVFLQNPYSFDLCRELDREGIRIRSCANFYGLDGSYCRIAVSNRDNNEKLLSTIKKITKSRRKGVTTGLCAAAAVKAATAALLSGEFVEQTGVRAENGAEIVFKVTDTKRGDGFVQCAVKKDAGSDPDVTNGIKIFAAVSKTDGTELELDGGCGVGRVTKPGLKVPVGKAAINPVPERMIKSAIGQVCREFDYTGGIRAEISIPGGAEIAKKTLNERLGVVGGLSVLGTTGILEPMSEKAIVETIKAEIDVQAALGKISLLMTPGNYGRDFAKKALDLDITEAIKCSNFIGEALDHACERGIKAITLIGHAGKLVKLAGGIMNTHSSVADCRMEILAAHCALVGAVPEAVRLVMECVTVEAAIAVMQQFGVNDAVWESVGLRAGFHLSERTKGLLSVEYIVFTQEHGVLIHARTRGEI